MNSPDPFPVVVEPFFFFSFWIGKQVLLIPFLSHSSLKWIKILSITYSLKFRRFITRERTHTKIRHVRISKICFYFIFFLCVCNWTCKSCSCKRGSAISLFDLLKVFFFSRRTKTCIISRCPIILFRLFFRCEIFYVKIRLRLFEGVKTFSSNNILTDLRYRVLRIFVLLIFSSVTDDFGVSAL